MLDIGRDEVSILSETNMVLLTWVVDIKLYSTRA